MVIWKNPSSLNCPRGLCMTPCRIQSYPRQTEDILHTSSITYDYHGHGRPMPVAKQGTQFRNKSTKRVLLTFFGLRALPTKPFKQYLKEGSIRPECYSTPPKRMKNSLYGASIRHVPFFIYLRTDAKNKLWSTNRP